MRRALWDEVLDGIEQTLDTIDDALDQGDPVPALPPFEPPSDVMPPMTRLQQDRAEALMRRQSGLTARVTAQIVTTRSDLGDLRRRRRAAVAYARGA